MDDRPILRVGAKIMIPTILLFGLYVQFHGEYGPGGGFQAGVIVTSAFILYALIYGLDSTRRVIPPFVPRAAAVLGVLIFAATGLASLLAGGRFLDYDVFAGSPQKGQHWGIFMVELGVFVAVFGVMLGVFYAFVGRGRPQ